MSTRRQRILRARALAKMWERRSGSFGTFVSWLDRNGVPYLSHTKISTVERCRRCYYNQYVLRRKADSPAIETGTLVHKAAQIAYERIREGRPVDFKVLAKRTAARHSETSCQSLVENAVLTLSQHLWTDREIVGVEEPFFFDLSDDLPPVIGVIDLILRDGPKFLIVDHKTGRKFNDEDEGQLVLYSEYVRQKYAPKRCDGVFDQYRMVPDLATVRKPVHMRTSVRISARRSAALVPRYRRAWESIQSIRDASDAWRGEECWFCFWATDAR